jgi:hypothetical protein
MDDILVVASTRWKLRKAIKADNKQLKELGLHKPPESRQMRLEAYKRNWIRCDTVAWIWDLALCLDESNLIT